MENSLDIIKQEIFKTINSLYQEYALPPQNISDKEWDAFFFVVESHFMANSIMNEYVHALNIVVRRALYFAKMNNDEEFTIEHLKKALCDLVAFRIYSDQIKIMQEEIDSFATKEKKYNYFK